MENLYYFAKTEVTLEDIRFVAENLGYEVQLVQKDNAIGEDRDAWLNIIHCYDEVTSKRLSSGEIITSLRKGYWQWDALDTYEGFEECAQEKLLWYDAVTAFTIRYQLYALPSLRILLQLVVNKHGGWVGEDDECLTFCEGITLKPE